MHRQCVKPSATLWWLIQVVRVDVMFLSFLKFLLIFHNSVVNPSLFFYLRFFRGNQTAKNGSFSGLSQGDETREHGLGRKTSPLLSGTAYCISSCSMIILNKVVLSGYNFNAGISLMFYQVCHSSLSHSR